MTKPRFPVFVDGRVQPAYEPALLAEDEGVLQGVAVFETLPLRHDHFPFLDDHLARLERGAQTLGIRWPPPWDVRASLEQYAQALGRGELVVRITLSRGPSGGTPALLLTARPLPEVPAGGVRVFISSLRVHSKDPTSTIKTTSRLRYVLAREEAARAGAFEALLRSEEGDLVEGSITNLFVVIAGELRTPGAERGALPGIVRSKLLLECEREPVLDRAGRPMRLSSMRIALADLERAEEAFLTNSVIGVAPICEVLGPGKERTLFAVETGGAGSVARALAARLASLEEGRSGPMNPGVGSGQGVGLR